MRVLRVESLTGAGNFACVVSTTLRIQTCGVTLLKCSKEIVWFLLLCVRSLKFAKIVKDFEIPERPTT